MPSTLGNPLSSIASLLATRGMFVLALWLRKWVTTGLGMAMRQLRISSRSCVLEKRGIGGIATHIAQHTRFIKCKRTTGTLPESASHMDNGHLILATRTNITGRS